jgi:ParB family chromosome partitioning protein
MSKPITKIKIDPKAALQRAQDAASATAADRFAIAAAITERQPTGLAPSVSTPVSVDSVELPVRAPDSSGGISAVAVPFTPEACVPGAIVRAPLAIIDHNPLSPRHIYRMDDVERIASTIGDGQDDAAHGYSKDGRIQLIDGGTRLRAARIADKGFLDVKIEEAPADDLALFNRARALNEQRSASTPLDFALSLRALMERGVVTTADDIIEKVKAPDGGRIGSRATVSQYLRMVRLPEKLQRTMSESEETCTFTAFYEISALFPEGQGEEEREKALEDASEIVEDIKRRKLNRNQIIAAVRAKLEGPAPRQRASSSTFDFGSARGEVKLYANKRQLDLSLRDIDPAEMVEVKAVLVKALEDHQRSKKQGS